MYSLTLTSIHNYWKDHGFDYMNICGQNGVSAFIANSLFQNTRQDSKHGHHQMVNTKIRLSIFLAAKDGEALCSHQKTRQGADCGSAHKLLIEKLRLKLVKVGKNARSCMYDANQILYDYTVEVTNRFKGLDLIDRVLEELWTEAGNCVGGGDQNHM